MLGQSPERRQPDLFNPLLEDFRMQENYMKGKDSPTHDQCIVGSNSMEFEETDEKTPTGVVRFLFSVFSPSPKTESSPSGFSLFHPTFSLILQKAIP